MKSTSGNDAHGQTLTRTAKEVQAATLTRIQHAAEMKSRKQTLYSSSRHISNRKTDIPRPSSHHPKSFPGLPSKNFSLLCEPINEYRIAPPNVGTRHIGALRLQVASKLMSCKFEVESHHSRLRTALHGFRIGSGNWFRLCKAAFELQQIERIKSSCARSYRIKCLPPGP